MNSLLLTTAWTLVHFVWQGAAIAAALTLVNFALRGATARARYWTACAALLLMLGMAAGTFALLSQNNTAIGSHATQVAASTVGAVPTMEPTSTPESFNYLPWLVYFWAAGVALLSVRSAGGWIWAQRLKRQQVRPAPDEWQRRVNRLAARLEVSRAVRLCESAVAQVPAVIGWLRPVILAPASALAGLPVEHMEALLAHELAHIRRHDYLVNLLQTAIETLLFYHPAVWWVSKQIRRERENCCDDLAVSVCGDVLTYARALTHLEHLRVGAPELAMAANGGSLLHRIQRLIRRPDQRRSLSSDWMTPVAVLLSAVSVWAATELAPRHMRNSHLAFIQVLYHSSDAAPVPELFEMQSADSLSPAQFEVAREAEPPVPPKPTAGLAKLAEPPDPAPAEPEPPQAPAQPPPRDGEKSGFIDGLASAGYSGLSIDQLIALKTHGVTPESARQLHAAGFKPTVEELLAMRIHGVTPEFATQSKTTWPGITIEQLVALRIHGAQTSTIAGMAALGYKNLSVDQVLAMQIHGATPEFARQVKQLGLGEPDIDQLLALRIHGVTPEWANEMKQLGLKGLDLDHLIALRIHGLDPAALREIKSLGFSNLSVDEAVEIGIFGIKPGDIRDARKHGFNNLTLEQLLKLKQFGILSSSSTI